MWTFVQIDGLLLDPSDVLVAKGYSGHGLGVNNPAMQDSPNVGPLPCGKYTIGPPEDTARHGPYFLELIPAAENVMFGRQNFGIHGDEKVHPNQHLASEGCIIMRRSVREQIWESGDHELEVVASMPTPS